MRTLDILMFTTFYPPFSFGGDAIGTQRMAQALAARGHRVTVVHDEDSFFSLGGKQVGAVDASDGVDRIGLRSRTGMVSNLLTQQTGQPVIHAAQLTEIAGRRNWDIVWYNNISLLGGPGTMKYGQNSDGTGLRIFEAHEHWLVCPSHVLWRYNRELCDSKKCFSCVLSNRRPPQLWRRTGMLDRYLDQLDLIIAKSIFSRDKHAEFGLKQKMTVLPYFLPDLDHEATDAVETKRPYFLFVGRLEKIKGLQDVFSAMDRYPEADLLILGDGDYAPELKSLAAANSRIRFLGRKAPEELNAYYRGALGLIVPSICYETFGIILIESFRLGTPVIARRLGPFPEIVERAGAGHLFSDEEDLLKAMKTLQGNAAKRSELSLAARRAFEMNWREDRVLEAYQETLARAAHSKGDVALAQALDAGAFAHGAVST